MSRSPSHPVHGNHGRRQLGSCLAAAGLHRRASRAHTMDVLLNAQPLSRTRVDGLGRFLRADVVSNVVSKSV